jgi:pilus assembly protein TadC
MFMYLIIIGYYLFICYGIFYIIRNKNFYRACENNHNHRKGKIAARLVNKINFLSLRLGKLLAGKRYSAAMKRNAELLKILEYENRVSINPDSFMGYRVILSVLFFIAGLFPGSSPASSAAIGLSGGVAGYFIPVILLKNFNRRRQSEINRELPDIIDLLVVATLSGQNIYNAIKIVIARYRGSICSELSGFIEDVDIGTGKLQAYKNLINRSSTDEFKNFVFTLIQAEKYGSSINDILKRKSDYIKFEAYQNLERKIRKTAVLILFPLVFLILPSFILLVGGPLIYSIGGNFLNF